MTVDPAKVAPGTYPIYVTVTDSYTGLTSVPTIVDLQVIQPAAYEEIYNSEGVYEEDTAGNVVASSGSDHLDYNDGQDPDFPLVPSNTSSVGAIVRETQGTRVSGFFNPLNPPTDIASSLKSFSPRNAGCSTVLNDTNKDNDPTSSDRNDVGIYTVIAYCNFAASGLQVVISKTGFDLNTSEQYGPLTDTLKGQQIEPDGTYNPGGLVAYLVYNTTPVFATPVSGHAERQQISYGLSYVLGIGKIVSPIPGIAGGEENYFVNKPGVFYPKIKMRPGTAVPAVFAKANGYVPFPDGPFYRCPQSGGGGCVRRSA